ncbi:hypothetical protein C5Y96_15650 [Blastopirellula marina]|uniref:Uncharacterized protein n=2 Tax=Pirellulales TaxID=2691354 RepID=A0A2S8FAM2_9BACT|nr:hypothetical protein C5Y96_15650 [Blastopirellula marina]RCS50375.1 hypothetical protein DTL36_15670 [Bremerella cremea]
MTTAQAAAVTQSVGTESIRRKINRTRRSVKLAELVAGILLFAAGSLLFLLTLAVIDHWIVGLNFAARLLAFLVYVVAAIGFLWIYVAPLLIHSINPLYAAKMIEQGQPKLKNSLLNFLFLSQNNQGTHKAVLDAVENQAATDISSLSLEHLVDYSKAIRIGYVLATLAVLFGLYTVLSPKNPLQTAARIAMPWNDIARPSRVKIVDVQPGDTSIYQGEKIEVVVKLHDVAEGDRLEVIYATKDGQLVDQAIPLQVSADGFDYRAMLSTSESGIQQDLTYRIEAGDAATRDFEVITLEAPSIDVASLRYDYPAYTKEAPWEQQGDGHIRALEGTMVTIHAISNRPIKKAYLEFDPVADSPIVSLNTIPLQVSSEEPTKASVRFPLEMNDAGTAGKFRSYQIRFRTDDGVLNPHPVLYHIDVVRDLPPEIEYQEPTASEVELPLNRSLDVRLRAIDPDYGIRQMRVTGTVSQEGGPRLAKKIDASLLDQPKSGQVIESWKLVPQEHKLEVGDIVKLVGVAEDTRTDFAGNLKPNVASTNPRTIRIVEPVAGDQQGKSDDQSMTDDQGKQSDEKSESNDSGEQGDQSGKGSESGDSGDMSEGDSGNEESENQSSSDGDSNQEGMKGKSDKPQEGENSSESDDNQSGQGSGSSSKKEQGKEEQDNKPGKGSDPQQGEQQSGEPQEGDPESGEGGMGQSQQEGGDDKSQSQSGGGKGGEASEASDNQQREQNQSEQTGQPNGSGTGKAGDPNKGGELQQGDASTQPNENSTVERKQDPVASDGSQDGDAFERIQDYLKEKQKQQGQQPPSDQSGQPKPQQQGEGEGSSTGQKPVEGMQDGAGGNSQQNPADAQGEKSEGKTGQGQAGKQGSQEQSTGKQEGQQSNENGADNGMKPENTTSGENATGGQKQEGEPGSTDKNDGMSGERNTQNNEQGASDNQGGAKQEDQEANPSSDSERSGDTGKGDNTNSGAGSKSNEGDKGSPESSEKPNKQGENNMKPDDRSSDEQGDQPKSPSNSDKQSNSKGETRGDQSGGGGSGGGQAAKQAGNDSAGSTSAADQGAGAANQQGEGETGQEGGDGPQADKQTGSSGEQKGEGSSKTNSPAGQESGMPGAESEKGPSDSQQSNDLQQSGTGPGNSAVPQGGGLEGNNTPQNYDGPRVEPGEDTANLEYAKKATDMVLDELKHQDTPDQEMLDKLGWSKDDFARFMQRWNQMKQAAGSEDAEAKQDLNDALRSLGLSRGEDTTRRVETREAAAGGSSDTQRGSPPPSFMEQYRAYLKGASQ